MHGRENMHLRVEESLLTCDTHQDRARRRLLEVGKPKQFLIECPMLDKKRERLLLVLLCPRNRTFQWLREKHAGPHCLQKYTHPPFLVFDGNGWMILTLKMWWNWELRSKGSYIPDIYFLDYCNVVVCPCGVGSADRKEARRYTKKAGEERNEFLLIGMTDPWRLRYRKKGPSDHIKVLQRLAIVSLPHLKY